LVAEDNRVNRLVAKRMLAKLGVEVQAVENGKVCVDVNTAGERPSLILMDLEMPVMDGIEATERIRRWAQENGQPGVPIVALTASLYAEDARRCFEAGMNDFLPKPIDLNRLKAMLIKWMGKVPSIG
jgi:CheY-like chemotaxis protein